MSTFSHILSEPLWHDILSSSFLFQSCGPSDWIKENSLEQDCEPLFLKSTSVSCSVKSLRAELKHESTQWILIQFCSCDSRRNRCWCLVLRLQPHHSPLIGLHKNIVTWWANILNPLAGACRWARGWWCGWKIGQQYWCRAIEGRMDFFFSHLNRTWMVFTSEHVTCVCCLFSWTSSQALLLLYQLYFISLESRRLRGPTGYFFYVFCQIITNLFMNSSLFFTAWKKITAWKLSNMFLIRRVEMKRK